MCVRVLEEARAALKAVDSGQSAVDSKVQFVSPPYAACHAGVNYYRTMVDQLRAEFPGVAFGFTLCCGDDAAIAHDALRLGFEAVICDCGDAQFAQLEQVAREVGALAHRKQAVEA